MTTTTGSAATPVSVSWGRLWSRLQALAAAPEDGFAFSRGARRVGVAYAAACVLVAVPAAAFVEDQGTYLQTWATVSGLLSYPALFAYVMAAHRARPSGEYRFWWWCVAANAAMLSTGMAVVLVAREDMFGLRPLSLPAVLIVTLLYMRAHFAVMRRRSGGRSVVLDAVETAIPTTVFIGAAVILFGDRLPGMPNSWWTLPCAVSLVGGLIGTVWAVVLYRRTPPQRRRVEAIAVVLGVLCMIDASAQLAQGLSGFTLPAAPLLVIQQLTMAAMLLIPLNASRRVVPGLELLSPQHQVRSSRVVTIFTIVALPFLGVVALAGGLDRFYSWGVLHFAGQAAILAGLLALRNLLALDETKRLYQQVEAAAAERQRLLGELSRSLGDDRHRVAAQLHQQAISSYATFTSFIRTASKVSGTAPLPETSERVQADLSRAAETWRELMLVVRPPDMSRAGSAERLEIATRALVMSLVDAPVPTVTTDVDERLHLDWATEAIVLRILQEAVVHAHDQRRVTALHLTVAPTATGLQVELSAEGVERDPGAADTGVDLETVRSFVALGHGELTVERSPTSLAVAACLGHLGPLPTRSPRLRVVSDLG
jgi:hypothetical protein